MKFTVFEKKLYGFDENTYSAVLFEKHQDVSRNHYATLCERLKIVFGKFQS